MDTSNIGNAWYEKSFGEDYLTIYKHRDLQKAYEEVKAMVGWLDLPQGANVLDLCCGMGRHALALADFGYEVTGMDLSEALLRSARKQDEFGRVKWLRGDMRQVPLDGPFDGIVNLFTSFGYFVEDEENEQVIAQISRLLTPDAPAIIDFLNPAYVQAHLVPASERTVDDIRIIENRYIAAGRVRKTIELQDGDDVRRYEESVRLYEQADFAAMFTRQGLRLEAVYGNYDRSDYDRDKSPRQIMIIRKDRGQVHD